jgi:glucokinase
LIGAVDIGGTKIAVASVEESGRISTRTEWPTDSLSPQAAVRRIAESLLRCSEGTPLRGIGIGCTGPVDPLTGIVGEVDLLPGWTGFPLAQRVAGETGVSTAVENDADAAALAEARWGAGKGASRFIYVTVSTGIGAGMVFDGKLYRGAGGSHPEAGHQSLDPAGPLCYCGTRGCWESLASGPAMAKWMNQERGEASQSPAPSAREICDLARQRDPLALRAVEREAEALGIGLANLVTLFCPDVIALGGGVMQSADLFLERASEVVRRSCGLVATDRVAIVRASLGGDAPLLGAAQVWLARFGESEQSL